MLIPVSKNITNLLKVVISRWYTNSTKITDKVIYQLSLNDLNVPSITERFMIINLIFNSSFYRSKS